MLSEDHLRDIVLSGQPEGISAKELNAANWISSGTVGICSGGSQSCGWWMEFDGNEARARVEPTWQRH